MRVHPPPSSLAALRVCLWLVALATPVAAFAQPVPPTPTDTIPTVSGAVPQRDILDVARGLFGMEVKGQPQAQPLPGLSFTFLPSVGYNPAYGAFVGVSVAFAGWLGDPSTTTTSSGSAGASYSTTGQVSVQFKSDFFTPGNGLDLKGDWRYLDTSQPTYGLGPVERGQSSYPMDFVLYRFYETAYVRAAGSPVYVGLGYHYNRYQNIVDERADAGEATPYVAYSLGYPQTTTSSGVSLNVLYESRDNTINAKRGAYWNASLRNFATELGSDEPWQSLTSDLRVYPHFPRGSRNTLAIWNSVWFTFGHTPYLDLPAIGWDTYGRGGRGYIQGRIRGGNQIYTEFEYRVPLTRDDLWGAVGFLSATQTTDPESGVFSHSDPGGGIGLRIKFNKKTATNLAVDLAWGDLQPGRLFFGMQEVF
jgi:outer membrane protein assembly factor BamA